MTNKNAFLPVILTPLIILLIPGIAMLFEIDGWNWHAGDFILAWVLMASIGLTYKLLVRKAVSHTWRIAAGIAMTAGFLLIWINGAVGLIGGEDNPANLMYAGVLAIGVIVAIIARLQPRGMAIAAGAAALAQFLVPVIALIIRPSDFSPGVVPVFGLNFFFVLLFATSAWLFRVTGKRQ